MRGVVSAGSDVAARAGAEMFGHGGNAVDAAVAAVFALTVVDPANTSIAGRCHVLVSWPDGRVVALDGRTALPTNRDEDGNDPAGARVVPVPGNPRTLSEAVERFGNLSLTEVVAPARRLASGGYTVKRCLGAAWNVASPLLRRDPATTRYFLHADGAAWSAGEQRAQPELAATLDDFARDGPDRVMDGRGCERIVAHLRGLGSTLTRADFADYRPLNGEVVTFNYRDWQCCTIGRQGHGYALAATFGVLDRFEIATMEPAERWATLALAQAIAHHGRDKDEAAPLDHMLEASALDAAAEQLSVLRSAPAQVAEYLGTRKLIPEVRRADTTHVSAVDETGLAAAITTSIGPHFGALVAAPDDAFMFAHSYRMAKRDRTVRRDRTEMVPTILRHSDGRCVALGAAGSSRIPGAVIRAVVNQVDLGMTPAEATTAPAANWCDGTLVVNPEIPRSVFEQLSGAGLPAAWMEPRFGVHYGLIHLAAKLTAGALQGGADPFWDGSVWFGDSDRTHRASPE
jgi:gamma-glutamyltranspeptidase/glutathione hydrolase